MLKRKSEEEAIVRCKGIELGDKAKPTFDASRRHLFAGLASLGAVVATGLVAPGEAAAASGKRRFLGFLMPMQDRKPGRRGRRNRGRGGNCFLKGTLIQTPEGERAIEVLEIGDLVTTLDGVAKPVKWIGRVRFDREGARSWSPEVAPVKIEAGSLDGSLPVHDLYVSGAHCVLIEGMFARASSLVNGRTISRCTEIKVEALEYLHIELEDHGVVFANGAPMETLLANGESRSAFDNYDEYVANYGARSDVMVPFATTVEDAGRLGVLASHVRRVVAPIYDMRAPLDVVRDALEDRAYKRAA